MSQGGRRPGAGAHENPGMARLAKQNAGLRRRAEDAEAALAGRGASSEVGYADGLLDSGTDPATWVFDAETNTLRLP